MASKKNKPVIFLAFANEKDPRTRERFLRSLGEEVRTLRRILRRAQKAGLCEVVERTDADVQDIFDVFTDEEYRDRVAVFHFGGHANSCQLLLEGEGRISRAADALGLAEFIGLQNDLSLVFLNACSTEGQARGFLEVGVSNVIATERRIPDLLATNFAEHFYTGLASGASIRQAFDEASAKCRTEDGGAVVGEESREYAHREDQELADATSLPWKLFTREGHQSVCEWNLPDVVSNPLYGLPPLPETELPNSPYRHLGRFEAEHAEVFFGRGYQIRDLFRLVTDLHSAPIVLYCGQTGVGKSSLLAAGLQPRLEVVQDVEYCRRTRKQGLTGTFLEALKTADCKDDESILDIWQTREKRSGKPLTIIVDQVEEVFTRATDQQSGELDEFLELLVPVFSDSSTRPKGKLILSFRKEWALDFERRMNEHKLYYVFRYLERLDKRGIIDAIEGPTQGERLQNHFQLTIMPELAVEIADDLLRDEDSPIGPTLQILLRKMWDAVGNPPRIFTRELYRQQETRMEDFLDRQFELLEQVLPDGVKSGLALDILTSHTTAKGTAEARTREQLVRDYGHVGETLNELMGALVEAYLLFQTFEKNPADPNGPRIHQTRLAHDTLAPLVRARFEHSGQPGQRARHILENRAPEWEGGQKGPRLDRTDLKIVLAGKSGMRAQTPHEERMVASSRNLNTTILTLIVLVSLALLYLGYGRYDSFVREERQAKRIRAAGILSQAQVEESSVIAALLVGAVDEDEDIVGAQGVRIALDVAQQSIPFDILKGHTDGIQSGGLACSHDNAYLYSGSWDSTTRKWDLEAGKEIWASPVGECDVEKVVLDGDSKKVATVYENHVVISTAEQGIGSTLVAVHDDYINSVAFSRWGPHLLTASDDGTLRQWNVSGGLDESIVDCERVEKDCSAEDSACPESNVLQSLGAVDSRCFGDVEDSQCDGDVEILEANYDPDPDGRWVVAALADGTARILEAENLAQVAPLNHHMFDGESGGQRPPEVLKAQFSPHDESDPDRRYLLTATSDGMVLMWDLREMYQQWRPGEPLPESAVPEPSVLGTHESEVLEAFWSRKGQYFLTLSKEEARLWRTSDLQLLSQARSPVAESTEFPHTALPSDGRRLAGAEFSPNGSHVVILWNDGMVRAWNLGLFSDGGQLGQPVELAGRASDIKEVKFCFNEDYLVTASKEDGELRMWHVQGSNEPMEIGKGGSSARGARFTPDGNFVVAAFENHPAQLLFPDRRGKIRDLTLARSIDAGHDSSYVLAVTGESKADPKESCNKVDDCHWSVITSFRLPDGKKSNAEKDEENPDHTYDKVITGPAGRGFLTTSENGQAKLWPERGVSPTTLVNHGVKTYHAEFHPDDDLFLTSTAANTANLGRIGAESSEIESFKKHTGWVHMAVFNDDGNRIATASNDNSVRLFDIEQPLEPLETFKGHGAGVRSVDFRHDGKLLVSAADDGQAIVWSIEEPDKSVVLSKDLQPIQHAEFSPDGQRILTASFDGSIRIWRYQWADLVAYLKASTRVCLDVVQRKRYLLEEQDEAETAHSECVQSRNRASHQPDD